MYYPQHSIFGRWRLHPLGVLLATMGMWLVYLILFQILSIAIAGLTGIELPKLADALGGNWTDNTPYAYVTTAKIILATGQVSFAVTAWLMAVGAGNTTAELQFTAPARGRSLLMTCLLALAAMPALQFVVIPAEVFTRIDALKGFGEWAVAKEKELEEMTIRIMRQDMALNLLIVAVLPAICEELFFRGFVQSQLQRITKPHAAIWLQAALFSAVHLQFQGFLARLFMGAAFGYLRQWSGSLWPCIVAHFVNNAVNVIVAYYVLQGALPQEWIRQDYTLPLWAALPAVALTAFLFYLLYQQRTNRPAAPQPQ
jgi:membrane protease YdiL (CAAX protease family)